MAQVYTHTQTVTLSHEKLSSQCQIRWKITPQHTHIHFNSGKAFVFNNSEVNCPLFSVSIGCQEQSLTHTHTHFVLSVLMFPLLAMKMCQLHYIKSDLTITVHKTIFSLTLHLLSEMLAENGVKVLFVCFLNLVLPSSFPIHARAVSHSVV